ncbi:MAG TPA: adenylate/guanylate cyclase domain-containing protein [Candidatus Bathyarchaeia archaeon]|nr:adenylate/guanylate cyclase domain-containing protein [Candidatus Bathyarchaeia archaeon]
MTTTSPKWSQGRSGFGLYELLLSWWQHRVSFLISLAITISALALYYFTFLGESPTAALNFLQRLEYSSLDTRFRFRSPGSTPVDQRIVIVDIDQHSQEILGKWPFSRMHFAHLLDLLHQDHAKVAAFDVTFSKPDQSSAPLRALWADFEARQKTGEPIDPRLMAELQKTIAVYDADKQFAKSIQNFGAVVLGNFFLHTEADLRGLDAKTLDDYANEIAFYSFPSVRPLNPATGKQDRIGLIEKFRPDRLVPQGTEANLSLFTSALSEETSSTGFFNVYPDVDGVVRRSNLIIPYGRSKDVSDWDIYASLDVQTVRSFLNLPNDQVVLEFGPVGASRIVFGDRAQVRTDDLGRVYVNFHGPSYTYPHYSMADVVAGKVPAGAFSGKIVLIGATATGIGDLRTTPFGGLDYPGVEIHANVIDNILHGSFLRRGARESLWDLVLIFAFGIPLGIWMALVSPRWMGCGVFLLLFLAAVDYLAFLRGSWLNFTIPALTLTANVILVSLFRVLIEEKEKRRVRTAFGQYLSPEVVRRLLLNPELVEPRKTEITVMFSDIRGFTTISEKLDAQELAIFLNQYLSDMTSIVFERGGTLDKYIGDAVMAFWNAPFEQESHAALACRTALDMMARIHQMQEKWAAEGKPRLDIGIGLNTGVASVGNMGSSLRYGYTALGDSVNLASRLEGLNKDYGTHILVNETTYLATKNSGFVFRELDLIRVKGKLQPVVIYELVAAVADLSPDTQCRLERFHQSRALFQQRRWLDAQSAFQSILDQWPDDGPARAYWKRCQEYLFDEPPSGWDGVFTMTHK